MIVPTFIMLTGCPRAPAYFLEGNLVGDWFQVASVGVICQANLVPETIRLTAGQEIVVPSLGVATTPTTYRIRLQIDDPRGGAPLTVTSNSLLVR